MEKEDFKGLSKKEIIDIFVDVLNDMEKVGNQKLESAKNHTNDDSYMFENYYAYGAALITKFNYTRIKIEYQKLLKMNEKLIKRIKEKTDNLSSPTEVAMFRHPSKPIGMFGVTKDNDTFEFIVDVPDRRRYKTTSIEEGVKWMNFIS